MAAPVALERIRARKAELLEEVRRLELQEADIVSNSAREAHHDAPLSSDSEGPSAAVSSEAALSAHSSVGFVGSCSLSSEEVQRYSRQMLLHSFGAKGSAFRLPCLRGNPSSLRLWPSCFCA